MLATAISAALHGVEARLVCIEADISGGFPRFTMLGLPDSCVKESEGRIRAALRNCNYPFKVSALCGSSPEFTQERKSTTYSDSPSPEFT